MNQPVYTTNPNKKHPAFILSIDADFFENQRVMRDGCEDVSAFADPINYYPHELFLEQAQSHLVIREREYLDNAVTFHESRRKADGKFKTGNPRYKQLLPYLVARQRQADDTMLYFPYRRTKQVGESRLAGNGSVGYGGHIDLVDVVMETKPIKPMISFSDHREEQKEIEVAPNSVIDLRATILGSLLREANEEFTVRDRYGSKVFIEPEWFSFGDLFILDNSNDVGELHLGMIMHLDIPATHTLEASEDELAKLPPMTADQMLTDPAFNAENWTRIYLEHITHPLTLAINHGGEKVGEIDSHFLADNLAALEAGDSDRDILQNKKDDGVQ